MRFDGLETEFLRLREYELSARDFRRADLKEKSPVWGLGGESNGFASLNLLEELQPVKICFRPFRLNLNDAMKRFGRERVGGVVEGQRHAAAIPVAKPAVTAALACEDKTIGKQGGVELACGERTESRVVDVHTLTATTGRSKTVALFGIGSPSSISSSTTICTTSWMFLNASSRVCPQVAAPLASSSGTYARQASPSASSTTWNTYDLFNSAVFMLF